MNAEPLSCATLYDAKETPLGFFAWIRYCAETKSAVLNWSTTVADKSSKDNISLVFRTVVFA